MKLLVAVPALNEAAVLGARARVARDGAADERRRRRRRRVVRRDRGIAREAGAHVISHAINLGVGAAMGSAFQYRSAREATTRSSSSTATDSTSRGTSPSWWRRSTVRTS